MNESENKTAKNLLDESIESIKRKEQSSTEKLPISEDTSISDPSEKTIITGNIPTEKQVENPPKALGSIEELKTINTETAIGNSNNPKELKEIFNKIEDNYNIKITKYNKEMYKQGFIDGVNLMINCLKSKEK